MVHLTMLFRRRIANIVMAFALVGLPLSSALPVFADSPPPCTPPPESISFHYPTGADSATFTYNCSTGLFENPHFTFDPTTTARTATDPIVYTCDPATNTYNVTTWSYSPPQGTFVADTQNVAQPPAGATVIACPPAPTTTNSDPTNTPDNASSLTSPTTPSGGSSTTNTTADNSATLNNTNSLGVNNTLNSTALSGNATLLGNTTVGNASTGNATLVANELNMLQSSNNFGPGVQPVTFVSNINGDVNGNFLLDPSTISSIQPASNTNNTNLNNNLTVNNTTNATLNNTLNLNAASGNATANANTNVGNVQTGNANAVADVVNTINSAILAGHSFLGVININGNLNGNILLPPDFVNQLLADNVPTVTLTGSGVGSTNTTNTNVNNTTNINNTNNLGINNIVQASATTGSATANGNTTTGNPSTGTANTNITAFNLTGSKVIGSNDLLVFVNVLGKWVGLIVNAPPGTTAAELGGGITTAGPNSTNTSNTNVNNTANITNKTNDQINNNINVNAKSGNATANQNTTVGNVGSGNANTAVNLLNVENSSLSLSNWFGILFINVFGTWNGSFGIDTGATNPGTTADAAGGLPDTFAVFSFVPKSSASAATTRGGNNFAPFSSLLPGSAGGYTASTTPGASSAAVLAATAIRAHRAAPFPSSTSTPSHINWAIIAMSGTVFLASVFGEQFYTFRHRSTTNV